MMSTNDSGAAPKIREIGGCEIIAKLGQGGMGTVFKARQAALDRVVALKVLPPSVAKDASFIDRFQREARASAKFSHPNVVNAIGAGLDEATGLWYFIMEYVDGPSLGQVLKERGSLPEAEALKLVRALATALECLSAQGLVHRDIKPDNILLTSSGEPKLADLGLAKDLRNDASLTQSGRTVGTPHYMAPEQVRGEAQNIDARTDIYALGGTLFHLVTGRTPFVGQTSAVIMSKHLTDTVPPASSINPQVSAGCSRLIERMMAKNPAERPKSPAELLALIDKTLDGTFTTGPRAAVRTTGPRAPVTGKHTPAKRAEPVRRADAGKPSSTPLLLTGGGALAVIVVGGLLLFGGGKKPQPPGPAETADAKAGGTGPASGTGAVESAAKTGAPASSKAPAPEGPNPALKAVLAMIHAQPAEYEAHVAALTEYLNGTHPESARALAKDELKKVRAAQAEAAAGVWPELQGKIQARAADGDYDGALELCEALPPALVSALKDKAQEQAAALRREATEKIGKTIARALEQGKQSAPAEGLATLANVQGLRFKPLAAEIEKARAKLQSAVAQAEVQQQQQAQAAARAALEPLLAKFDLALLNDWNLAEAQALAERAAALPVQGTLKAEVDGMAAMVAACNELQRQELAALNVLKGKPFTVGKESGIVKEIKNGNLVVEIALTVGDKRATALKHVSIKDLSEEQRAKLITLPHPATPAAFTAAALQKLRTGKEDAAVAGALLEQGKAFALAGRYSERAQMLLRGPAEAKAQKDWAALSALGAGPCDTPEKRLALQTVLDTWVAAHGETEFAKSRAGELQAIHRKLKPAAAVNAVANGDFEGQTPAPWKLETQGEWWQDDKTVHGGFRSLRTNGSGKMSQLLELVPGEEYRVSVFATAYPKGFGQLSIQSVDGGGADRAAVEIHVVSSAPQPPNWKPFEFLFRPKFKDCVIVYERGQVGGALVLDDLQVLPSSAPPPPGARTTLNGGERPPGAPEDAVLWDGHAYKYFPAEVPWEEARQRCEAAGGHLATIHSREESDVILNLLTNAPRNKAWIGMLRSAGGEALWVTGEPVSLSRFDARETARTPDGGPVSFREHRWTVDLSKKLGYVCEWEPKGSTVAANGSGLQRATAPNPDDLPPGAKVIRMPVDVTVFNGHSYRVIPEALSWAAAKARCESWGGQLATVDSKEEDQFLKKLSQDAGKDAWLGFVDLDGNGQWVWASGAHVKYTGWANNQEPPKKQLPRAAYYAANAKQQWADDTIEKTHWFICEWGLVPPKTQK